MNWFLTPFLNELITLVNDDIISNGWRTSVRIRCFICDTPAWAALLGEIHIPSYIVLAFDLFFRYSR